MFDAVEKNKNEAVIRTRPDVDSELANVATHRRPTSLLRRNAPQVACLLAGQTLLSKMRVVGRAIFIADVLATTWASPLPRPESFQLAQAGGESKGPIRLYPMKPSQLDPWYDQFYKSTEPSQQQQQQQQPRPQSVTPKPAPQPQQQPQPVTPNPPVQQQPQSQQSPQIPPIRKPFPVHPKNPLAFPKAGPSPDSLPLDFTDRWLGIPSPSPNPLIPQSRGPFGRGTVDPIPGVNTPYDPFNPVQQNPWEIPRQEPFPNQISTPDGVVNLQLEWPAKKPEPAQKSWWGNVQQFFGNLVKPLVSPGYKKPATGPGRNTPSQPSGNAPPSVAQSQQPKDKPQVREGQAGSGNNGGGQDVLPPAQADTQPVSGTEQRREMVEQPARPPGTNQQSRPPDLPPSSSTPGVDTPNTPGSGSTSPGSSSSGSVSPVTPGYPGSNPPFPKPLSPLTVPRENRNPNTDSLEPYSIPAPSPIDRPTVPPPRPIFPPTNDIPFPVPIYPPINNNPPPSSNDNNAPPPSNYNIPPPSTNNPDSDLPTPRRSIDREPAYLPPYIPPGNLGNPEPSSPYMDENLDGIPDGPKQPPKNDCYILGYSGGEDVKQTPECRRQHFERFLVENMQGGFDCSANVKCLTTCPHEVVIFTFLFLPPYPNPNPILPRRKH